MAHLPILYDSHKYSTLLDKLISGETSDYTKAHMK